MSQSLLKRRSNVPNSNPPTQQQNMNDDMTIDDEMSASLPRSIPAPANFNSNAWDATSMISAGTAGGGHDGDDETLPTLASKGVESLFFSGLTNIDENRPLRGINHFARAAHAGSGAIGNSASTQGINNKNKLEERSVGRVSMAKSVMSGARGATNRSILSSGTSVHSSGTKSVRSVFTEKKQEDIDRLFEDLLGQPAQNNDAESQVSSVMSSVMPISGASIALRRGGVTEVSQRNSGAVNGSSNNSHVSQSYSHNQYIFDQSNGNGMAGQSEHDLIYGDDDSTKKLNYSMLDRFSRFYRTRNNRMLHIRAGFILLFLCSIMFIVLQTTAVQEHNREQMKKLRDEFVIERAIRPNYISDRSVENNALNSYPNSLETKKSDTVVVVDSTADQDNLEDHGKHTHLVDEVLGKSSETDNPNMTGKNQALLDDGGFQKDTGPTDPLPTKEKTASDLGGLNSDIKIPESFNNIVDVNQGSPPHREMPFFWQVPRAGGGTLRQILSECMGAVLAAEPGGQGPFAGDNSIEVVQVGKGMFVNVDTTFLGGIERAKELKLLESRRADVLVSPYVFETSTIFTPEHKGRMFAFMRHPIERCASIYAYKKTIDPEIASMSLLDYARSGRVENNWMTRFLSNQLTGELTFDHVVIAKEVLRTKCLIGLKEFLWASIKRYEHFFDWSYTTDPAVQYECRKKKLLEDIDLNEYEQPVVEEGTQEWTMLLWQNKFDMKLYKYAQELFQEQLKLFPDGYQ